VGDELAIINVKGHHVTAYCPVSLGQSLWNNLSNGQLQYHLEINWHIWGEEKVTEDFGGKI
jgi:hypothetical protein